MSDIESRFRCYFAAVMELGISCIRADIMLREDSELSHVVVYIPVGIDSSEAERIMRRSALICKGHGVPYSFKSIKK